MTWKYFKSCEIPFFFFFLFRKKIVHPTAFAVTHLLTMLVKLKLKGFFSFFHFPLLPFSFLPFSLSFPSLFSSHSLSLSFFFSNFDISSWESETFTSITSPGWIPSVRLKFFGHTTVMHCASRCSDSAVELSEQLFSWEGLCCYGLSSEWHCKLSTELTPQTHLTRLHLGWCDSEAFHFYALMKKWKITFTHRNFD